MVVSGYSGNIGDAFSYSNGTMFITYDNVPWNHTASVYHNNCAVINGGGFWYSDSATAAGATSTQLPMLDMASAGYCVAVRLSNTLVYCVRNVNGLLTLLGRL